MINVLRQGDKLIGIYDTILTNEMITTIADIKQYLIDSLMAELKAQDESDLFTYQILEINEDAVPDLFGRRCAVAFEFIPNKELVEQLKVVHERLGVGL